MIIHCFDNAPQEDVERLKYILNLKTNDKELIKEAIYILKKNKSIEFAQNKAKELILEAWKELNNFLEESDAKKNLRVLVDFLIERDI